jgi:hypothetical protein
MRALGINLTLRLGQFRTQLAPKAITEALESVEVTHSDCGPAVFQLKFHADRSVGASSDFALLSSTLLQPRNRLQLTVTFNGTPRVLMDGFITTQELSHERAIGASTLTVTGEDVSVMMDLIELSFEYPAMGDAMIAEFVLAKYLPLGVIPDVSATMSSLLRSPLEQVPQQNDTDRNYLNQLAGAHGYVFYVKPGPACGDNTAYWGPPKRGGPSQRPLSVDMGPATNVDTINFNYNALAPLLMHGMVQDNDFEIVAPVMTWDSMRFPRLSANQPLLDNQPFVRNRQFVDPRLGILRALDYAQTETSVSTDKVVTAQGSLDALRYGDMLDAPGRVAVRGVGATYDGLYYVQSVTHSIARGAYKQNFTLQREGTGSTINNARA